MPRIVLGDHPDNGKPAPGVDYAVEPGDWLTANVPLDGEMSLLLERQAGMFSLAKVVSGSGLRAEIPFSRGRRKPDFLVLEKMMSEASARIHGLMAGQTDSLPAADQFHNVLTEFRNTCPWEIVDSETGLTLFFRNGQFEQKIHIETRQQGVRLWLKLFKLGKLGPFTHKAITHFCLDLNAHLRMARASLLSNTVVLEVLIEERVLNSWCLEKAVEALVVGTQLAKREGAVLLNSEVAQSYCDFHHLLT